MEKLRAATHAVGAIDPEVARDGNLADLTLALDDLGEKNAAMARITRMTRFARAVRCRRLTRASRALQIEIISSAELNIDHRRRRWSKFFVPSGRARACTRPAIFAGARCMSPTENSIASRV